MRNIEVQNFIENYMYQVFDDDGVLLDMYYDVCSMQHKGLLKIFYGDFAESFDVLIDDYHIESQIIDFCNHVVCTVKQSYLDYIRKEK